MARGGWTAHRYRHTQAFPPRPGNFPAPHTTRPETSPPSSSVSCSLPESLLSCQGPKGDELMLFLRRTNWESGLLVQSLGSDAAALLPLLARSEGLLHKSLSTRWCFLG